MTAIGIIIFIAIMFVGWQIDGAIRLLASAVSEVALELRWARRGEKDK